MPLFKWDGAIDGFRKTLLAFSNERIYIMQRDDPLRTLIPRLTDYSEVEIMVVARPMRGAEGMGAAAVGPGHALRHIAEQPRGKGRRRERNRLRGHQSARELARRTAYTASDAPGVPKNTGILLV